jgi:hypothetical protein
MSIALGSGIRRYFCNFSIKNVYAPAIIAAIKFGEIFADFE